MRIINLYGGPGSGKSTTAAVIFSCLKNMGQQVELVHEAAKFFFYKGATSQLENQFYVMAKQYARVHDLDRSDCRTAISDSPLLANLVYARSFPYYEELKNMTLSLTSAYKQQLHIYVRRTKPFSAFGRTQANAEEAINKDIETRQLMKELGITFDLEEDGDAVGQIKIAQFAADWLTSLYGNQKDLPRDPVPFVARGEVAK